MKIKLNTEIIEVVKKAFLKKIINDYWKVLPKKGIYHLVRFVEYDDLSDMFLADNENMHPFIEWERVGRSKLIRVISRNINLINKVDLKSRNYSVKEIIVLLRFYPQVIDFFNINLNAIDKNDAYLVLNLGHKILTDKISIEKYEFNFKEIFNISKSHKFSDEILKNLDLKILKSRQVAEIISHESFFNYDLLKNEIKILTALDWLNILKIKPELFTICNLNSFSKSDIYKTIELIILMKDNFDLSYLLDEKNLNEISPLGWVKLIVYNPDKYLPICNKSKLNRSHWNEILKNRPEIIV